MAWTDKYPVGTKVGLTSVPRDDPYDMDYYDGVVTENPGDGSLAVSVQGNRIAFADEQESRRMSLRLKSEEGR